MKKYGILLLTILIALLLCGCAASPAAPTAAEPDDRAPLVSADTESLPAVNGPEAALYFRFWDTAYLAPEQKQISVQRDQTLETALVEALIAGPSVTASSLSPLFPEGTQVLAVSRQGDTLFVTFNEALLSGYADEPGDLRNEPWKTEAPLRRRLCMDALAATLTEAGLCARVQVLVYPEKVQKSSMRLTNGYFTLEQDDTLAPPLTRNEETLLTAHNAAQILLDAWMTQNWARLYGMTCGASRPNETAALNQFSLSRVLSGFTLSHGSVSPDGQTAVLTADLSLQSPGEDTYLQHYPLILTREGGLWKMSFEKLEALMQQE